MSAGCAPEAVPLDTHHHDASDSSDDSDSHSTADVVPDSIVPDTSPRDVVVAKKWQTVSVGEYHTVALDLDGKLHCWGQNNQQQCDSPDGQFVSVSAGSFFNCAIDSGSTLHCWGQYPSGDEVAVTGTYIDVGTGHGHLCARDDLGWVSCWGDDSLGQVSEIPQTQFKALAVGGYHTCVLHGVTHTLDVCWGHDNHGQLGPFPKSSLASISAGELHNCGIRNHPRFEGDPDGGLTCWGNNDHGQADPPPGTFVKVSAGYRQSCGIDAKGAIACWGDVDEPPPSGTFTQLNVGHHHSCAINADDAIQCWGDNSKGQATPP
jgi:alpha-tubulin suppressor-like RCC1 family protein